MGLPFGIWMFTGWRRGLLLGIGLLTVAQLTTSTQSFPLLAVDWTQRVLFGVVTGIVAPLGCLAAVAAICLTPRLLGMPSFSRDLWALAFGAPDAQGYWAKARAAKDRAEEIRAGHQRDPGSAFQSGELKFEGSGLVELLGGRLLEKLENQHDVRVDGGVVKVGGVAVGRVSMGGDYESTHPDGIYSGARFDEYGRLMMGGARARRVRSLRPVLERPQERAPRCSGRGRKGRARGGGGRARRPGGRCRGAPGTTAGDVPAEARVRRRGLRRVDRWLRGVLPARGRGGRRCAGGRFRRALG